MIKAELNTKDTEKAPLTEDLGWSCDEHDDSIDPDEDEAIYHHLDGLDREEWPATLTVFAYAKDVVALDPQDVVADIYDRLDEKYSSEDGEHHVPSPDVLAKVWEMAAAMCKVIADDYEPWTCHRVPEHDITINVMDWVRENEPGWLEGDEPES